MVLSHQIEERRKQIVAELEEIRKKATEDPTQMAQFFDRMNALQKELYQIDPPELTPK